MMHQTIDVQVSIHRWLSLSRICIQDKILLGWWGVLQFIDTLSCNLSHEKHTSWCLWLVQDVLRISVLATEVMMDQSHQGKGKYLPKKGWITLWLVGTSQSSMDSVPIWFQSSFQFWTEIRFIEEIREIHWQIFFSSQRAHHGSKE